ncbi:MAG: hypothetical protein K2Y39_06185 [Candidatus Obscuribacterales bacterium]|nr:hypothetical protein [Candidatus Obscuribacterales bacterium]
MEDEKTNTTQNTERRRAALHAEQLHYEKTDPYFALTPTRCVIFSKEISIDPKTMRRLQPKIILEEGYRSRDYD